MSQNHLFISYASEDRPFAEWLARKLASEGYAVWFDKLELLGGESWPRSIEEALQRSGRLLAVMSAHSIAKDLPIKERTAAADMGRTRNIPDFIIPLRLDSASWDWTMKDLTEVPFHNGWAEGWKQILKKLEQIQFPRTLATGAVLASQSFDPSPLVIAEPESLRLNAIPVQITEKALRIYQLPEMTVEENEALKRTWAHYHVSDRHAGNKAIALTAPPNGAPKGIVATRAQHSWADSGAVLGIPVSSIIPALVRGTIWTRLQKAGCRVHPNPRKKETFYLPAEFTESGKLPFTDLTGKHRTQKIRRFKTVRRGLEKEKIYFHLAFRVDLAKGLGAGFFIQIVPTLMLFEESGVPITDDRVNRLRKKITQGYYNAEWRDRFLAAEQLLLRTQENASDGLLLAASGITLQAPCRLDESQFEKDQPSTPEVEESEDAGEAIEDETDNVTDTHED